MKKDEIFCCSTGCYSDYGLIGHFVCLIDFDIKQQGKEYLATDLGTTKAKRQKGPYIRGQNYKDYEYEEYDRPVDHTADGFIAMLTDRGLIKDVEIHEYHLGDYGTFRTPEEY